MDRQQLLEFVHRDRGPVEELRAAHWRTWSAEAGAAAALALADSLRRDAQALHPGWPDAAERDRDHETHRRVSEALRRVHPVTGR